MEKSFPKQGDIVHLKDGNYAIVIRNLTIKESRQYGFLGYVVSSHGKEFVVDENDISLVGHKELKDIFIKEKIEPN